jgi:NitT/TauT family transport system ATP-binding protein
MIQVKSVSMTFKTLKGSEVKALENVTFNVEEGEFVSIVGPSGCGKSTLLRIIAGLIKPTSGEIIINGKKITEPSSNVGFVFQSPVLMPWKRVRENILFPIELVKGKVDEAFLNTLISKLGLDGFENAYPFELSGGMQTRVSIGRALVYNPEILLMDEPFGPLDALTRESLGLELLKIWSDYKKTVLFVTHDISEAVFLSDKVVVMSPRPGTIKKVVDIDLERPRGLIVKGSYKYAQLCQLIREELFRSS